MVIIIIALRSKPIDIIGYDSPLHVKVQFPMQHSVGYDGPHHVKLQFPVQHSISCSTNNGEWMTL